MQRPARKIQRFHRGARLANAMRPLHGNNAGGQFFAHIREDRVRRYAGTVYLFINISVGIRISVSFEKITRV